MIHRIYAGVSVLAILIVCMFVFGFRASCGTHASESAGRELRAGLENRYLLAHGDGRAMLGIVIDPRDLGVRRSAVSLALVIDTSGSMAGFKIEHARSASQAIVDALADGDEISLTTFESTAQTVLPLMRVDAATRVRLHRAIVDLRDGGGTALADGMARGLGSLAAAHNPSRRLLLISDGQGNVGPSSAQGIIAALPKLERGVTLSTIGVGTDYDENVLTAIAAHGAGGFHHLADPVQLTQILADELQHAHGVVGTDAVVEIRPQPGVVVQDSPGLSLSRGRDGVVRILVGDLDGRSKRTLAIPVRVPVGGSSERTVGTVRLSYRPLGGDSVRVREVGVRYAITAKPEEVAHGAVAEFMVAADRTRVAHALTDAAELLKQGDLIEAQAILQDERTRLSQRRDRLAGSDRTEVETLISMLRDPYIDAASSRPAPNSARLGDLVEIARRGDPLPQSDLAGLDAAKLRLLRNVPYARHGYPFRTADLQREFASFGWYRADAAFDNNRLSRTDADNVALVHSYEAGAQLRSVLAPAKSAAVPAAHLEPLLARVQRGEPLAEHDLKDLDLQKLRLLRNTVYARHGYVFRAADLQAAFRGKSWYRADPSYEESRLSVKDRENINLVQQRERSLLASVAGDAVRDFELRSRAAAWSATGR